MTIQKEKIYNKCGVYYIRNIINSKIYIGGSKNIGQRFSKHKSDLKKQKHGNIHLQRAVDKYGIENFIFGIIIFCDLSDLNKYEQLLIKFHDSLNRSKGYNLDSGGNINLCRSKETIEKIRKALTGRKLSEEHCDNLSKSHIGVNSGENHYLYGKTLSEETKEKLSSSHSGNRNYNYGKHFSEEHKRNLSIAHTGKKMSEESKMKMSNSKKGRALSEETKKKLSVSHKGLTRSKEHCKNLSKSLTGKKATPETIQKIIESQRKRREKEKLTEFFRQNCTMEE